MTLLFQDEVVVLVLGFRIYYGDGAIVSGSSKQDWESAPSHDVQVVLVFYDKTYDCYEDSGLKKYNYKEELHGLEYYWFSPTAGYGGAPRDPIPVDALIKHGKSSEKFLEIYNRSLQDRKWL